MDSFMDAHNFTALPSPAVYVLINGQRWKQGQAAFDDQVIQLIKAGVCLIQFRDKTISDRAHVAAGERLSQLTKATPTAWIMNDRVDLAIVAGAHGVHLGQDDLPIEVARKMMPQGALIGVSTHSIQQARAAEASGADYIGVGPVFESETKHFSDFVGVDLVTAVANEIKVPAFAIGGINLENVSQIHDAGVCRIAVSGVVNATENPGTTVEQLLSVLSGKDSE